MKVDEKDENYGGSFNEGNAIAKRYTISLTMKVDEHDENYGGSFNEVVQKKIKPLVYYSFSVKSGNIVNTKMCVKIR
jgi:hypothetical protein